MPGSPPTSSTEPLYKTAAGDAIELTHAGRRGEGRPLLLPVSDSSANVRPLRLERIETGIAGGAGGVFLDQRIPLAAGLALALPAIIRRAAVLADKGERVLGHAECESQSGGVGVP